MVTQPFAGIASLFLYMLNVTGSRAILILVDCASLLLNELLHYCMDYNG
jgi:hypothetical protein